MKRSFLLILSIASLLYAGETAGVTSRVRITADESNKNWEQIFFGERLRTMFRDTGSDADAVSTNEDFPAPPAAPSSLHQKKTQEKQKTVEYHIIQESSEQGKSVRKVKKRIVTEPLSSDDTTTSEQHR